MANKKKIIVFEEEWKDNFYMKMESYHDNAMSGLSVNGLSLTETFSGSPFLVLRMQDSVGDLISHTYISPDADYDLYIGESQLSNTKSSFSLSVNNMENINKGKVENVAIDLTFVNSKWNKFLSANHSRSWKDKRYSEVVADITGMNDYSSDIEDTLGKFDVIQPNWTTIKFIRWLAKQAINVDGVGGYEYGLTSDDKLIFKSLDTLYSARPKKVLMLSTPNNDFNLFFDQFNIRQDYAPMITHGAGGIAYTYFDYDTKTFVTGSKKISDSNTRQLSDWAYISEEHNNANKVYCGGRDTHTPSVTESKVLNVANSIQKLSLTTHGDTTLHIGDIIEIVIPSSEFSKTILAEQYSGFWMIGKLMHSIDFEEKTFQTSLTLIRAGINGIKIKGLVKTAKGKKVGK